MGWGVVKIRWRCDAIACFVNKTSTFAVFVYVSPVFVWSSLPLHDGAIDRRIGILFFFLCQLSPLAPVLCVRPCVSACYLPFKCAYNYLLLLCIIAHDGCQLRRCDSDWKDSGLLLSLRSTCLPTASVRSYYDAVNTIVADFMLTSYSNFLWAKAELICV